MRKLDTYLVEGAFRFATVVWAFSALHPIGLTALLRPNPRIIATNYVFSAMDAVKTTRGVEL